MDALFFRALAPALGRRLQGARIDNIYGPEPGSWSFPLSLTTGKSNLLYRPDTSGGLLFFCRARPANPAEPGAGVMWLRKRVRNRRVVSWRADWPGLRLALELSGSEEAHLVLDLRRGLSLAEQLDHAFFQEPGWPSLDAVRFDPDIWREHPHLSPALRLVLSDLPEDRARALYAELRAAPAARFYVNRAEATVLAWPPTKGEFEVFDDPVQAAQEAFEPAYFAVVRRNAEQADNVARKRAAKRIRRTLKKVERDRERMEAMAGERIKAEALQGILYSLDKGPLPRRVTAPHPEAGPVTIELDGRLRPADAMQRLFGRAAKGERGLKAVAARKRELEAELRAVDTGGQLPARFAKARASEPRKASLSGRYKGLAVGVFVSSDGFTMVRGKNAKANHRLLSQAASPFDYWFHARDAAGAHVVLRRDHPSQEVPQRSLEEAAALAALASPLKDAGRAEVTWAQVRNVRKIKGAAHGLVRLDGIEGVLTVEVDKALEQRLAAPSP